MLWLSLGENCLTDDILSRYGKKSFSTPYSPCRSNIEYALNLERLNYHGLLDSENLKVEDNWGKKVVRSKLVSTCEAVYYPAHMAGFEFTHHDPLNSEKDRISFQRKIQRLDEYRGKKDFCFLYFHRKHIDSDLNEIRRRLREFCEYYKSSFNKVHVSLFYQTKIEEDVERRMSFELNDGVLEFEFRTNELWEGKNPDVFWGRVDDDLIEQMINTLDKFVI
ncbi:DUF1796 family putative cysteine peptidase [Comamonas thiooxydans]|uniref:DUF1796 family putative cysteine peptidase n=1 Tax=Comamonas thiooxydans TaxID=363952 RepID=UPI0009B89323|nr:DUF1796 family putative cysteine peptidase [Comamonas thiooxydans]